ncbi:hypothetical protein PIIN_04228 [Serendipita indica DSM 11827]|uniref:Uncharacterized protein n=1 Tax=Serendipita indica (strain DSM 11827) TaxID=1109443 RepID=G4TG46_SERID|nr:hypothetical protein PIIN_04228 [Serendipita indica DSM 11827]
MNTRWPEIGSTIELIKAQDTDLVLAHELMHERGRLEQEFVDSLRKLVEKHKSHSEFGDREYSKVRVTAFEQGGRPTLSPQGSCLMRVEIEARSDLNPDIPERAVIETMVKQPDLPKLRLKDYPGVNELEEWFDKEWRWPWEWKMPLIQPEELEYSLSVQNQRELARKLQEWYETKLQLQIESHHSALEDTKVAMINTMNAIILTTYSDRTSTCSRIYSHALTRASNLVPLNQRASIQARVDLDLGSQAFAPVDYYNWFFDGQTSPLYFGTGTLPLDFFGIEVHFQSQVKQIADHLCRGYHERMSHHLLQVDHYVRSNTLDISSGDITLFEHAQYGPLLPLNSEEFEQLKSASSVSITAKLAKTQLDAGKISRRDLIALLVPDEPVWEPLGSARRKELLELAINKVPRRWLTFRMDSDHIVEAIQKKWDFETDKPSRKRKWCNESHKQPPKITSALEYKYAGGQIVPTVMPASGKGRGMCQISIQTLLDHKPKSPKGKRLATIAVRELTCHRKQYSKDNEPAPSQPKQRIVNGCSSRIHLSSTCYQLLSRHVRVICFQRHVKSAYRVPFDPPRTSSFHSPERLRQPIISSPYSRIPIGLDIDSEDELYDQGSDSEDDGYREEQEGSRTAISFEGNLDPEMLYNIGPEHATIDIPIQSPHLHPEPDFPPSFEPEINQFDDPNTPNSVCDHDEAIDGIVYTTSLPKELDSYRVYVISHPLASLEESRPSYQQTESKPLHWPFETEEDFLQAEIFVNSEMTREKINAQLKLNLEYKASRRK